MRGQSSFKNPGVRTVLRPSCLTAPIILQGCDFSKEPPQCRSVKLSYISSCAEIQVKKAGAFPSK